jgi:hypothetical protein
MFAVVMSPVYQDLASQDSSESGPGEEATQSLPDSSEEFHDPGKCSTAETKIKSNIFALSVVDVWGHRYLMAAGGPK